MAITGPRIGTSAFNETGKRRMSEARVAVRLSATGKLSEMIGRSVEAIYTLAANHNFNKDTLINWMNSQGTTPVVINMTGDVVGYNATIPTLDFPSTLKNEYVILNINAGTLYGRGGNSYVTTSQAGGTAINNAIGTRLRINNRSAIAGGGGAGGSVFYNGGVSAMTSGGGGRPFGVAGPSREGGNNATLTAPGAIFNASNGNHSGAGGNVAAAGTNANARGSLNASPPGGAGKAVTGNAPTWINVGTIYGTRV